MVGSHAPRYFVIPINITRIRSALSKFWKNDPDPGRLSAPWKEPTVAIAVDAGLGGNALYGRSPDVWSG